MYTPPIFENQKSIPRVMVYDFVYLYLFILLVIKVEVNKFHVLLIIISLLGTLSKYNNSLWAGSVQKIIWWLPVLLTSIYFFSWEIVTYRNAKRK